MKLEINEFFDEKGGISISENGWVNLRNFCATIIYKYVGKKPYTEDLISTALIECIDSLPKYDYSKNNQLGGYLYFKVRGVISKEANKAKWEIPTDLTRYEQWK